MPTKISTDVATRSTRRPRIFVSAVSSELTTAREIVGQCLRVCRDVDVVFQQEFGTQPGDLLEMLRRQVDECDGVLQLIGDVYGAAPRKPHPGFEGFDEFSYTQFELLYARQQGKKTWLIRIEGSCTRVVHATEYVVPDRLGQSPRSDVEAAYRARLRRLRPGQTLTATAKDDSELRLAIDEHHRRRLLQREYAARLHTHLTHTAVDDDDLVKKIQELKGVPESRPRTRGMLAGLPVSMHEGFLGRAPLTFGVLARLNPIGNKSVSRRIVLHGLGGTGKTTLATEIGHFHNVLGHHVLMVRPVAGRELDHDIAGLADRLGLSPAGDARVVRKWLRDNDDWLLIFDGIDDADSAKSVHAFAGEFQFGHFLITSCLEGYWKSTAHVQQFDCVEVDVLEQEAGHRLLRVLIGKRRAGPERHTRKLSEVLGGLPLAIQHARGFLANNEDRSIASYAEELESAPVLPDAGDDDFAAPPRPIAATWQASLRRVEPTTRTLLRLLSFLTDHPIPLRLLKSPEVARVFGLACATDPFEETPNMTAPDGLFAAVRQLAGYSLLRRLDGDSNEPVASNPTEAVEEERSFVVHRLVLRMTQASLRAAPTKMLPEGLAFQQALARGEQADATSSHREFMHHAIRFLTDYVLQEGPSARTVIYPHLAQLAAVYLRDARSPGTALLPLRAEELFVLAETFSVSGDYEEAGGHFTRAAEAPDASPLTRAKANQGLAWNFFDNNKLPQALERYGIAESVLRDQPFDAPHDAVRFQVYSGRGWVLRALGQIDAAIIDLERAATLATAASDPSELSELAVSLGGVYDYAGEYERAAQAYDNAVRLAVEAGNPFAEGPALYMRGWFLIRQGSVAQGMAQCEDSLAIGEQFAFGTVIEEASWIMALGYALQGESTRAVEASEHSLKWSSPFLAAWEHLIRGIMRYRMHDVAGAKEDFAEAIADSERSISEFETFEHLDTLAFARAGLVLLGTTDHLDGAIQAYQRARELAPARGIADIGLIVFSSFGAESAVNSLREQLVRGRQ